MRSDLVLLVVIATFLLIGFNGLDAWKYDEGRVIHVGGKVMCQDCTKGWNEWAHGGSPIKGSRVSITCMDERNRVVYYGSDDTDQDGQFSLSVDKYVNHKELKLNGCLVRLLSSPDPACNVPTDFGGGKSGVRLYRPSHFYRDQIKYTLSPFYFTSPMCDEPDTTKSYGSGRGY